VECGPYIASGKRVATLALLDVKKPSDRLSNSSVGAGGVGVGFSHLLTSRDSVINCKELREDGR
jgi:hypothetical protein